MKPFAIVILIFLCLSCNKTIFSSKEEGKTYAATILQKTRLAVSCRDWKTEKDNVVIEIWKSSCDTIRVNGIELISRKPLKQRYYWFLISSDGSTPVQFTEMEALILKKAQHLVDSLQWCQENKNFLSWKMIGAKRYLN